MTKHHPVKNYIVLSMSYTRRMGTLEERGSKTDVSQWKLELYKEPIVTQETTDPGCACDIPSHAYAYSFALNVCFIHTLLLCLC